MVKTYNNISQCKKIIKLSSKLSYKLLSTMREYTFIKYVEHKRSKRKNNILIGYRMPSISIYSPKPKKVKQGLLLCLMLSYVGFIVMCCITPFTNWLIYYPKKIFNKIGSMWVYK